MATKHRSTVFFPALTQKRDALSKQARFLIRMALACHQSGVTYDVQWTMGAVAKATLTAEGDIPMPKPFPKPPRAKSATWKPNIMAEASYRANVNTPKAKEQSGWIIEHSSGLCLVKFGQSDTGELVAPEGEDIRDGWMLTHTATLLGTGVKLRFQTACKALLHLASLWDGWSEYKGGRLADEAMRAVLTVQCEYVGLDADGFKKLESLGGFMERPETSNADVKPQAPTPTPVSAPEVEVVATCEDPKPQVRVESPKIESLQVIGLHRLHEYISRLADKVVAEWWANPNSKVHCYATVGDAVAAADAPEGYTLAMNERLCPSWSRAKARAKVIEALRSAPILPQGDLDPQSIQPAAIGEPKPEEPQESTVIAEDPKPQQPQESTAIAEDPKPETSQESTAIASPQVVGPFTDLTASPTVNGGHLAYFAGKRNLLYVNGIRVGSTVTWKAFTDCFGEHHDAVHGLVVESITLHASKYGRHVRIVANGSGKVSRVEGNARAFTVEQGMVSQLQVAACAPTLEAQPKPEQPQETESQEAARKAMMSATYSPEDNKLRLYTVERLDPVTYARVKAAGFAWAPQQKLFVAPRWTPEREDLLVELAGEVGDEDTSLVDRAEMRAERFEGYSANRAHDAHQARNAVERIADGIPLGQPILVGHHSERHARRDAERIENGMRKAVKMWETAEYWRYRAKGAIRAAKYKELPAVRHRRIKALEADLRSCIADYTPQEPVHRIMQTGFNDTEPSVHVWVGPKGRGGRWVKESSLPAIKARNARWEDHYRNRIEYEKAMLAESGGIAADSFDIKIGGRILVGAEWLPVLRINKANGEIRSVTVAAPGRFTWRNTLTVEIEAVKQYREPEAGDEEKARQSVKKAPLCNYPGEGFRHLTKAEWEGIWGDYKSTRAIDGTHRVRYAIFGGHRINVYLTDSKRIDPPAEAKPIEPVKLPVILAEPEPVKPKVDVPQGTTDAAEFAKLRETLRQGVQVVAAPQLFPTPPEVARHMVELAGIRPGSAVLEPSAGTGRLLDALLSDDGTGWKTAPISRLVAVEANCKLAHNLRATYAAGDVRNADFLECGADELGTFDAVLMNPPFENGVDIKHIQHAAGLLKPGGRLVAICANGPRQNEKLKPLADSWEELPAGTFAGTNVRAALLVISKPKPVEPTVDATQERIARLLAELKASRLPAPAGKMAVRYPDGRVGYIPDPAAKPPRSQGIKTAGVARKHVLPSLSLGAAARAPA